MSVYFVKQMNYLDEAKVSIHNTRVQIVDMSGFNHIVKNLLTLFCTLCCNPTIGPRIFYREGEEIPLPFYSSVQDHINLQKKEETIFSIPINKDIWTIMEDSILGTKSAIYLVETEDDNILFIHSKKSEEIFQIKRSNSTAFSKIKLSDLLLENFSNMIRIYDCTNLFDVKHILPKQKYHAEMIEIFEISIKYGTNLQFKISAYPSGYCYEEKKSIILPNGKMNCTCNSPTCRFFNQPPHIRDLYWNMNFPTGTLRKHNRKT